MTNLKLTSVFTTSCYEKSIFRGLVQKTQITARTQLIHSVTWLPRRLPLAPGTKSSWILPKLLRLRKYVANPTVRRPQLGMPFLKKYNFNPRWKEKEEITYKSGSRNTVYFLNGDKHIGEWKNNLKEGKGVEFTRANYLYEGDFSEELRHGHGVLSKRQGDGTFRLLYNGEWAKGKRHGYGIQRGEEGAWYDGNWREGKRSGDGRMWLSDGTFYHGQWLDDKMHGMGVLVLPNGNRYEGEFACGLKHGEGKFFHIDSKQVQEGVWDEDVCVCSTIVDITSEGSDSPPHLPPNGLQDLDSVESESKKKALEQVQSKSSYVSAQIKTEKTSNINNTFSIKPITSQIYFNTDRTASYSNYAPVPKDGAKSSVDRKRLATIGSKDTLDVNSNTSVICFKQHRTASYTSSTAASHVANNNHEP